MRISTNTMYQAGISKIGSLQSEQSKLQQQISLSKRILTPSDDPVAAARALGIEQVQNLNNQYARNRVTAKNQLSTVETTLSNISELLTAAQSSLVSAGNPTYDNSQRGFLAQELRGSLDQLIGLANTKDGAGNYLFSGFQTNTAPFVKTATGANYQGDDGQQFLQVTTGRQLSVSDTGRNIFQTGSDVFASLTNLINLLETPIATAADAAALTAGLATNGAALDKTVDNVLNARASVGTKLKELDSLDTAGQDQDLQLTKALSELQDLDYAKAISQLSQQQMILSAAQQSFVKTVGLSLFNLI
ncbi:MAG TPA: flagellar hook-associated protein FlgL [Methylophilaceae bacterium]|nr:flagellar hook-associated protein FlgL [Methylophilaceae bacterium]